MSMAACYSMDLYCDAKKEREDKNGNVIDDAHAYNEFPHQFTGETFGQCKQQALVRGWTFKGDGTHLCPKHSGKRK